MADHPSTDDIIKKQLTELLTKGNAHVNFEDTVAGIPFQDTGIKPENLPYSIWKLVEHIRITQWDILEFSRNPQHQSPEWPAGYWPQADAPAGEDAWNRSLQEIISQRDEFIALINNPAADLYTAFPYGNGQNLLREAMLIADHTSYHSGQILVLRRLLHNWKEQ